jgi:hypothetical protein
VSATQAHAKPWAAAWRSGVVSGTVGRARAWARSLELLALVGLALLALVAFRRYADDYAGGADSYGYVSEALRLSRAQFYAPENVFSQFGLPEDSSLSSPLGYAGKGPDGTIPTYPFGYPLLMSLPIRLFGFEAAFWVTPILGAATVVLTCAAARPHLGRLGGFLAAGLVLFLPNFIFSAVQPMSDVPAAFCAALSFAILLNPRRQAWTDVLLGATLGLGIWIRPNMGLLLIPATIWLVWRGDRRALLRYGLGLTPFLLVEAAVNWLAYGAPWTTGYGEPPLAHSAPEVAGRAMHYVGWLNEQQVGVGVVLLAAGLVFGRLARPYRVLLGGSVAIVWAFFAAYPFDDAWWYGRFLLPVVPAVAILQASALVRVVEVGRLRAVRIAFLLAASAIFMVAAHDWARDHSALDMGRGERKYATVAEWTRQYVQGPSVVLAMQHSGSLRLYGDLPTARYDADSSTLLRKLGGVQDAGGSVYLLVEGWELENLRSQRPALLEGATQVGHFPTGDISLFRLADFGDRSLSG